ncbi:hypothetical protein BDZ89DRAFT_1128700 [Hymenopellis radicata]|nr:hypothetical protein BDZ89DRAFT_1128700 [Hymenopellis radicata]
MDENFESFAIVDHDEQAVSKPRITLKLPSLRALKAQKPAKPPRPVKLKPLKEVLTKLIAQIKKKDDYAFFLHPVNVSEVPGYSAVVKRPMDFGTMTNKVARGKYRSLEDFTSDLRLVTANAKAFNAPGSIYYTEADKIEVWALDLIAKASATVIQYETDWNIDVENDGDDAEVNVDDDDDMAMDVDDPAANRRSQSVMSASAGPSVRRSTRGPYKKTQQTESKNPISESIDADGHLPGARDGLGVFPPNSDLARTMFALKLKGKKYKTKKERLRFEKEGPPFHVDGSLDYWEMEDPYTMLSALAPEPLARPRVIPLYPPPQPEPSGSATPQPPHLGAVTFPSKQEAHIPPVPPDKKHWNILRSYSRLKKDEERLVEKQEREVHTLDWGSLSVLSGELADDMKRRGIVEESVTEVIKEQLDVEENVKKRKRDDDDGTYFSSRRAAEAETYLEDVVYGGVDGYAYIRSLAQFLKRPRSMPPRSVPDSELELGMPLARWVERNVLDPLTDGQHSILKETARLLVEPPVKQEPSKPDSAKLMAHIRASEYIYPLIHLQSEKIDMASLIHDPDEIFRSEEEWEGKKFKKDNGPSIETPDELKQVLEYVEAALMRLIKAPDPGVKVEESGEDEELRRIRLNLLALVKRAPVDLIAPLPKQLAHEKIRSMVPVGE